MNTRSVTPYTIWAVLAMEAALVLPVISLPTQGDRLHGLIGPLLLVLLLPLGYVAVYHLSELRDPSWRLLVGIGLALATRAVVSSVPDAGVPGLAVWLGRSVVPASIGIGLWWRGGALCVAELTPAEIRTEFSVLAVCLLAVLSLVRPFLLSDPLLLGGSVALFTVGGLASTVLSRQDAAEATGMRRDRTLAAITALVPAVASALLVSILRPELLGSVWSGLARIIELLLTPVGLLIAWLASLFPRGPVEPLPLPPRPPPLPLPNPAALGAAQERPEWIGWVVFITLLLAVSAAAIVVVRLLLANWIGAPARVEGEGSADLQVERTGTPAGDAHDLFGWLVRWLRARLAGPSGTARSATRAQAVGDTDAWGAYQRLLRWADSQGLGRTPSETTGQLETRLKRQVPDAAETVELVTSTYEWERYGAVRPANDRLRRIQAALRALIDR